MRDPFFSAGPTDQLIKSLRGFRLLYEDAHLFDIDLILFHLGVLFLFLCDNTIWFTMSGKEPQNERNEYLSTK